MEEDEINYRTLRKIQQMEKNSPTLTELKSDFYKAFSEYLDNLNNRLERENSSQKQLLLKDEIQNAKKIVTNIYEHREKKILLVAISKARGGNPDLKNLIDTEEELFNPILELMQKSRKTNLERESTENNLNEAKTVKIEEENKETEKSEENNENQGNPNPIVRVTQDIPEFVGTDEKKYNLRNNDIVSLPEEMSEMLSKRGVVEKIKPSVDPNVKNAKE